MSARSVSVWSVMYVLNGLTKVMSISVYRYASMELMLNS